MKSRKQALADGDKQYHGKPCKNCGTTLKFTSSWGCVQCTTERTVNRDPEVYKRYIKSEKGQEWIKEFRNSKTNRDVQNRYHRKRYKHNPEWYRSRNLEQRYNITLDEYNIMLEEQGGVCYICKQEAGEKKLAVDHNHETGINRKLLCHKCNTALGLVDEDVNIMKQMINYIEEHS